MTEASLIDVLLQLGLSDLVRNVAQHDLRFLAPDNIEVAECYSRSYGHRYHGQYLYNQRSCGCRSRKSFVDCDGKWQQRDKVP